MFDDGTPTPSIKIAPLESNVSSEGRCSIWCSNWMAGFFLFFGTWIKSCWRSERKRNINYYLITRKCLPENLRTLYIYNIISDYIKWQLYYFTRVSFILKY